MTKNSYKRILLLIFLTAVSMIGAQCYYAYQDYLVNKQRFIIDVKQALDESIESYFADKAKNKIYIMTAASSDTIQGKLTKGFAKSFNSVDGLIKEVSDSGNIESAFGFSHVWSSDSVRTYTPINIDSIVRIRLDADSIKVFKKFDRLDSLKDKEFEFLTQKVMVSISEDLLDLGKIYTRLDSFLLAKNISIETKLIQEFQGRKTAVGDLKTEKFLSTTATSALLGSQHTILVEFENATLLILQNGLIELAISILLIGLVLGTMMYLYRVIYTQKQLAEIKDDLISNITHEFKTPIATIFSALEGVTNFNKTNDPQKTKRYIDLSNDQLKKLNNMVEKMLETAVIDQGKLSLSREEVEVAEWTRKMLDRFMMIETEKSISFESSVQSHVARLDRFHLENAVSNLIDNAIKYGGDRIVVRLLLKDAKLIWEVEDNGLGISNTHQDKVFEKLYRIPTGNEHNVKGFGIGLFYARTIAELHEGTLTLEVKAGKTLFTLSV